MSIQFPIKVEKNSTYKIKLTLKTSQGALDVTDIKFEGEVKNSVYDSTGVPISFDKVDAYNGNVFLVLSDEDTESLDFHNGIYVVRYVAQDGLAYRLMEGDVEVVWEGEGEDNPVDTTTIDHITINLDGDPEVTTLATVGLPGPKLTYGDLTEADKEDLRKGVYEAVQDRVDVAVEAKDKAVAAGDNAQAAATLIQNTLLPEAKGYRDAAQQAATETQSNAQEAAQSAQSANLSAQDTASIRDAVESLETSVEGIRDVTKGYRDEAEQFKDSASASAQSATTDANTASTKASEATTASASAKTYRDQAETFKNQAQQAAQTAFQSGGTFTPTSSKEYPDVPTQDTRWTLKAYTFTSGDLSGETAVDGDTLLYDVSDGVFILLRTGSAILGSPIVKLKGADGISYEGPEVTLTASMAGALPDSYVPSWGNLQGIPVYAQRWPTVAEVGALPNTYVPAWGSITGKPDTATRWPTPSEVGALPDSYLPDWSEIKNIPNSVTNPLSPVPVGYTSTSGTISGPLVTWAPNTTSTAPSVTLGSDVQVVHVKDVAGNAKTNNITLTAPSGNTIEGSSTLTIDKNYGWVRLQKLGSTYRVVAGG